MKDITVDKYGPRKRLMEGLDEIFSVKYPKEYTLDAVESKVFGIGAESYTVGSNEFYMGYAVSRGKLLCLDAGHFHPTELISDKISAVFCYLDELLLHVSRPVRWDSDHVVILDDELKNIAAELVRNNFVGRTHIGLDFFDASINRIAAWVIGMRNMQKALLGSRCSNLRHSLHPMKEILILHRASQSWKNSRRCRPVRYGIISVRAMMFLLETHGLRKLENTNRKYSLREVKFACDFYAVLGESVKTALPGQFFCIFIEVFPMRIAMR